MKQLLILALSALLLLTQCTPQQGDTVDTAASGSSLSYAQFLSIHPHDNYTEAIVRNPWDTTRVLHRYIIIPREQKLPENLPQGTVVRTPLNRSLVYAAVHCSLLEQFNALDQIGGVCDLSYIKAPGITARAQSGQVTDAGNSLSPNMEKVIALNPDAILLSPFENAGYGRIGKMGIPIIECADYLETTPLGRAEWMKLLGLLYGKEAEADSLFALVENNYIQLQQQLANPIHRPIVMSELKSGSAWYMPGGKSYLAQLFRDAGASYPWSDNTESGSIPLSFETVFAHAGEADIWLIKGLSESQLSYSALAKEYAPYAQFKPYREKTIYGCNTAQCFYFEETPFRPDLLLQELAALFHPELYPHHSPRYYKPLLP